MRRVLMIDNYDSFTFNLVQYLGELGVDITVWRNDGFALSEVAEFEPDGIIVSPGPCTPREAGHSLQLIREYGDRYPILGVCLGHQAIAEAFGGKVVRARQVTHGKTSPIEHDGSGIFAGLPAPFTATRYHSLITCDLPDEIEVNAWLSEAGERVVMGIRHRHYPVWGVQFHPESILTEHGHEMLRNFLALA